MLEMIRSRAQGFFAWLIVGGIIITFALFGINQYLSGGGDNSVARVNGAPISQVQLERAYAQQRQRLTQMFGGELPAVFTEQMLKQQSLQQLVAQEVMIQAALENGMRVSNEQLVGVISGVESFQENGTFSRSRYEELLARQGLTPGAFESGVRRDILAAMFESGFRDTAFVTSSEENNLLRLEDQQRTIGYLTVAIAPYEKTVSISDDEINNYYQSNTQRFMQPERVKAAYLELNAADLANKIKVDEQMLRSRYEAQKINYSSPEERKASHILVKVGEDAPADEVENARQKASAILERARKGEDFAKLAKDESDDSGSAKNGGDLGFFGRGAMVPSFEEAAFKLKKGELSELVRSPFGFHIIKLIETRGGEVKPFAQVKDAIRKEIQNEEAVQQFYEKAEKLENMTYEHPESLQLASDELGLPIKVTDYFTRQGGSGIAADSKVLGAAFGDEVLLKGNNSESIELERNHVVVLRIKDHQPEAVRPLEEVKASIVASLKHDKAKVEMEKRAAELLQQIRKGSAPDKLADGKTLTWKVEKALKRESKDVDGTILKTAFSMLAPSTGNVSSKVELSSGDQAVIVLYKVIDGDPAKADEKARQQAHAQLQRALATADSQTAMAGVRTRMDISIRK